MTSIRRTLLAGCSVALLAGCDTVDVAPDCGEPPALVRIVPESPVVSVGGTVQLSAVVRQCGRVGPASWSQWRGWSPLASSYMPLIVDLESGRVTGVAPGTMRVDVYLAPERSSPSGSVTVTVR
jgi:hypothetical protein